MNANLEEETRAQREEIARYKDIIIQLQEEIRVLRTETRAAPPVCTDYFQQLQLKEQKYVQKLKRLILASYALEREKHEQHDQEGINDSLKVFSQKIQETQVKLNAVKGQLQRMKNQLQSWKLL